MYKRILLKLSGEALAKENASGLDHNACLSIAQTIKAIQEEDIEIGVVIGGGNFFRGTQAKSFGFTRVPADHIGMLATSINGLALAQVLASLGLKTRVMSSGNIDGMIEPFNWTQAKLYLEKKVVVIFVGGTGNPYFTTDTAAALRANEMEADVLLKATKVDGIYDSDPFQDPNAKKFDRISYNEALSRDLNVMDGAAIALCRDTGIPIHVIDFFSEETVLTAVRTKQGGTIVSGDE